MSWNMASFLGACTWCSSVAQCEQCGQSCPVPFKEGLIGSLGTILGSGMWGRMKLCDLPGLQDGYELPEGQRVTSS